MELIRQIICPGRFLLDIGCVTGEALIRFGSFFKFAIGTDASFTAVQYAMKKTAQYQNIFLMQGNELFFQKEIFDCCLLLDVLEHLQKPEKLLSQVTEIITKKGHIIVSVPNWTDKIFSVLLGLTPEHRSFHSHIGWKRLIESFGFKVYFCRAVKLPFTDKDFLIKRMPYLGMCIMLAGEKK